MAKKNSNLENKIIEVLENLRPYLNSDGGDIEFIEYQDGVVFVRLSGACGCCPHKNDTIKNGVLAALQEEVPEVLDVIDVEV